MFAFILNIVLLSIGGATAVAAMSVVMYAESITSAVIIGACESLQPAISYCQGAGLKERVIALEKRILFFCGSPLPDGLSAPAFLRWFYRSAFHKAVRYRVTSFKYPCYEDLFAFLFGKLD